jgi:hypothetical protein
MYLGTLFLRNRPALELMRRLFAERPQGSSVCVAVLGCRALDLGWKPVPDLIAEIHDGDPLVRAVWSWQWWGLEPLDRRRHDWQTRYASAVQVGGHDHATHLSDTRPPQSGETLLDELRSALKPPRLDRPHENYDRGN